MSSMGATCTDNALINLWELAADHMEPKQLKWFAGLTEFAQMEAENLSTTLSTLATLHENDENGWMGEGDVTNILYSASYQVATLAALINIATSAADRLNNPNPYEKMKKEKEKFVAASDDEAEEICTDFLRRRGLQAKKKKPD
jgi:hypothetical protein